MYVYVTFVYVFTANRHLIKKKVIENTADYVVYCSRRGHMTQFICCYRLLNKEQLIERCNIS